MKTGMNKQNAIRHVLAKCRKVKNQEQYQKIIKLMLDNGLEKLVNKRCDVCSLDDFGICMVDSGVCRINDTDKSVTFCTSALLKVLQEYLNKRD